MTIKGLHQHIKEFVKSYCKANIEIFEEKTIGIDAYVWLHEAVYVNALQLIPGNEATVLVDYLVNRALKLIQKNINLFFVFDGNFLPSKAQTEKQRFDTREKARNEALQLFQQIKNSTLNEEEKQAKIKDACKKYASSIDITPQLAHDFIVKINTFNNNISTHNVPENKKIQFIIAPYEADAQLAYLARENKIAVVLAEDGDFIAYNTPNIFFKMDKDGNGDLVTHDILTRHPKSPFYGYSNNKIFYTCLLAGCDYAKNLPSFGIEKACQLVSSNTTINKILYQLIISHPKYKKKMPLYIQTFTKALITFSYYLVWNPELQKIQNYTTLPSGFDFSSIMSSLELIIGKQSNNAQDIANGIIDPSTGKEYLEKFILPLLNDSSSTTSSTATTTSENDSLQQDMHVLSKEMYSLVYGQDFTEILFLELPGLENPYKSNVQESTSLSTTPERPSKQAELQPLKRKRNDDDVDNTTSKPPIKRKSSVDHNIRASKQNKREKITKEEVSSDVQPLNKNTDELEQKEDPVRILDAEINSIDHKHHVTSTSNDKKSKKKKNMSSKNHSSTISTDDGQGNMFTTNLVLTNEMNIDSNTSIKKEKKMNGKSRKV